MEPYDWKMNKIPLQNSHVKPVVAFRYPVAYGGEAQDYASVYQREFANDELSDKEIIEFDNSGSDKKKYFKKRRNSSPMRVTLTEDCSSKFTSYVDSVQKA